MKLNGTGKAAVTVLLASLLCIGCYVWGRVSSSGSQATVTPSEVPWKDINGNLNLNSSLYNATWVNATNFSGNGQFWWNSENITDYIGLPPFSYEFKPAFCYNSIIQGTWVMSRDTEQIMNYYVENIDTTAAINDAIQFKFSQKSGAFTLHVLLITHAGAGNVSVLIDNMSQGFIDCYSASTTRNVIRTLPITVLSNGVHTLDWGVVGKNVSSGNYMSTLTAWWITD